MVIQSVAIAWSC